MGRAGRDAVYNNLKHLKENYKADVIIINVENAAHGFGVTQGIAREFLEKGCDVMTTGNHVWQQRDIVPFLEESKQIIRPLNYPENSPGRGSTIFELANGKRILITQVLGRLFMDAVDNPALVMDKLLKKQAFDRSGLIYGIGHAVYSLSDPRALIFEKFVQQLSAEKGREDEYALYAAIARLAPGMIAERRKMYKGVSPNIDFYSGFVYDMLGLPVELFTPIFAISRVTGWSAHRIEELVGGSKIIRPAYKSVAEKRAYVPLVDR